MVISVRGHILENSDCFDVKLIPLNQENGRMPKLTFKFLLFNKSITA